MNESSFALMTALIRLGIFLTKFLQKFSGIARIQINLAASIEQYILGMYSEILSLTTVQKFSIGLRSGLFSGHFRKVILSFPKKSLLKSLNDGKDLCLA